MRVLIIQMEAASTPRVRPRFCQWLGVLGAVLRQDGHELSFAAFSRYRSTEAHEAICLFRPQAIYIHADRFAADITRHVVELVGRHHLLPVVLGGPFPTALPDEALSIPGVLAIAIGEPEVSVRRFLWALERGEDHEQTPGIWINPPYGSPVKNEPAPLTGALDLLPFADRELFDYAGHVAGTRCAQVSVARGCPNRCGYCMNSGLAEWGMGFGPWVRRRSPASVCDEIDLLCERYPAIERIEFVDHAFALDGEWLAEFASLYADRCGLPFTCHLRANAVRARTVRLLERAGCAHAVVEVISGSDFIRNEVFEMATSDRHLERAFRLLAAGQIAATAVILLGSPYETPVTVDRTVELVQRLSPDRVVTRLFAPWPGTPAERLCRECGWLAGLADKAFCANQPMLRMPAMPPEALVDAFAELTWQARHPRSARLMRLLARIPVGRRRSLYDLLVRRPVSNGRLLPADPRAVEVVESDGAMAP